MPTDRAMKAAEAACRWGTDRKIEPHRVAQLADLIDRAAGLPELEARVAELEREKTLLALGQPAYEANKRLSAELDAALRRLEAVIHKLKDLDEFDSGAVHAFAADCLRLARGEE